jgi:hypothetical protein
MDPNHCLFVAGMLQMFCELGQYVHISNYYHLLNGLSVFNNPNGQLIETPVASIFRFYQPALPGEFLPLFCESPMYSDSSPAVHALCLKSGNTTYLYVINFSTNDPANLNLPQEFAGTEGDSLVFADGKKGVEIFPEKGILNSENAQLPPCSIVRFKKLTAK